MSPHGLGLRLDAAGRVQHEHRAVEDAHAALDLDGEVDVTRRVHEIDVGRPSSRVAAAAMVIPRSRSSAIQSMTEVPSSTRPT